MNPCCNGSLQTGTKLTAIFQMITSSFIFLFGIWLLAYGGILTAVGLSPASNTNHDTFKEIIATVGLFIMVMSAIVIIAGAASIISGILLLVAATKRNRSMCMTWFIYDIIFVIVLAIQMVYEIFSGDNYEIMIMSLVAILMNSYFLSVVWAFMAELKQDAAAASPYANPKPRV